MPVVRSALVPADRPAHDVPYPVALKIDSPDITHKSDVNGVALNVVNALGVQLLKIGDTIDPGVPWCHAASPMSPEGLHITLKSGNFGGVDFFTRSLAQLQNIA